MVAAATEICKEGVPGYKGVDPKEVAGLIYEGEARERVAGLLFERAKLLAEEEGVEMRLISFDMTMYDDFRKCLHHPNKVFIPGDIDKRKNPAVPATSPGSVPEFQEGTCAWHKNRDRGSSSEYSKMGCSEVSIQCINFGETFTYAYSKRYSDGSSWSTMPRSGFCPP